MKDVPPNPVGYQNKDVARLLSNQIATFESVGGEGSKLSEFRPVDESGDPLSDEITVQFYSDRGKLLEEYTWTEGENIRPGMPDGWYDEDQEEPKDRDIGLGEGFKIYTTYNGGKMIYSGEVDIGAIAIPIPRLLSSTGNIRPCPVKMSSLTPVDAEDEVVSDEITLQFYSDRGKLLEEYTWTEGENIRPGMPDGWYDEDQEEPKDKDLAAGQGFCIYTTYSGAFLKFPAIGSK